MPPVPFHALAETVLAAAFAAATAMLPWRSVRTGRRSVDLLGLLLLFLGVQSLHAMAAGLLGTLTGPFLGGTAAAGLALETGIPALRRRIAACAREALLPAWRTLRRGAARRPGLALAAAAAAFFLAVHAAMFVVLSPPLTFDALTYHLSKVAHWIRTGSLYLPDLPVKRVFWPSGMELLDAWWAVFLHHELLVETPGLFFHAIAVGATWALARNAGLGRRAAGWAAVAFSVTPVVVVHGTTCLTDLPTAAVFLYLLALWTFPAPDGETARRRWLLTAAAGCFGLGIKPTIAFMVPGLAVSAVPVLRKGDFAALRSVFRAPRVLWAVAVLAAALGSFWYLRNAVRFGNPFYPVVAGTETEDGIQSGSFSLSSLKIALSMLLAEGGILDGKPVIANLYRATGWGWTAVCCGIPCSFFFALRSRRFRWLLAGQAVSACTVLAMVRPDFSCLRFLLWIPSVLCVGVAAAVSRGGLPRPVSVLLAAAAAWNSLLNCGSGLGNAVKFDWVKQLSAIGKRVAFNGAAQARFARFVPADEDIAVFMYREGPLYLCYGPGYTRLVHTIEAVDRPVDFAGELDAAGLRFLFFSGGSDRFPLAAAALRKQLEEGLMTDLHQGLFVRGSEIPPDQPKRNGR